MPNPEERKELEDILDRMVQLLLGKGYLAIKGLTFKISPEGCTIEHKGEVLYDNTKSPMWRMPHD